METSFPLLFAAFVGFSHALEADHLVAVGNLVTKRDKLAFAIKDGIYWGLGHTSTIVLIGFIVIVGKATFLNSYFSYFEAIVGIMLILLGCFRLYQYFKKDKYLNDTTHSKKHHHLAYGVGLVHGLAGSGAMVLLVMTEIQSGIKSMVYLAIFGIGSMIGMLVAAGIFSLPFSKKMASNQHLQFSLILLSSILCIMYGAYVAVENLA